MEAWQERVVQEYEELNKKIDLLQSFFTTATYYNLDMFDKIVMQNQYYSMQGYALCLQTRINRFNCGRDECTDE